MTKKEIQGEILQVLTEEITKYEEAIFQISRNKSMRMRYLWDMIRENYYGVFKKEKDLVGQQKIFFPLTEALVWENVKNIDIDTKDINVRGNNPSQYGIANITRNLVRDWMEKNCFGEQINKDLMIFALDGHLIKKKLLASDEYSKKTTLKTETIDIRNIFKDQSGGSLHEDNFIERSVQSVSYLQDAFKGKWINLDKIKGETNIPEIHNEDRPEEGTSPEIDLYERWGKIPKSWLTGRKSDCNTWVNGRVVASGLVSGTPLVHRVEEWNKVRPYEEAKFEDAPGRWAGRGIGEKVLYLQMYLNTIYNVRRNNNLQMMNQLFQFREGSGVTPDKISRLLAGGAIGVQTIGDIARIDTRNINFNESISEEQNAISVANRLASSQEASTGEALPSSTPATNAIIQARAVKTSFQLRQEKFGLYLSKLFKRQLLPDFWKIYKKSDILRLMGEEETNKIKRKLTKYYTDKFITERGQITPQEADRIAEEVKKQIQEREDLWIELDDLKDVDKLDISFYITDETFDKATILQNLQQVLIAYKGLATDENSMVILRNMFDIMGLDSETLMNQMTISQPGLMGDMGEGQQGALASQQEGAITQDGILEQQENIVNNKINE